MSKQTYDERFSWGLLGDMDKGRQNLGTEMPVTVYRLFQYTLRDVLSRRYGKEECQQILRESGCLAGMEFAEHILNLEQPLDGFISHLQDTLIKHKIGVLRIETIDETSGNITLTISEDLDCSGLPLVGESVCYYDEGFLKGILDKYTKRKYSVVETDCWAKGDRVCRFNATVM